MDVLWHIAYAQITFAGCIRPSGKQFLTSFWLREAQKTIFASPPQCFISIPIPLCWRTTVCFFICLEKFQTSYYSISICMWRSNQQNERKKKTFCKFLLHERMTHHLSFAASFASKNFHPPFASNLYRCLTSLCICTPFIASRAFHATRTALELVRSKQEFVRHEH